MCLPNVRRIAFPQRLRSVDDEQTAHLRVETPLDQVVQQCLRHRRILRRTFQHTERMLHPIPVDADRRQQHQIVLYMDAINLDHQQVPL